MRPDDLPTAAELGARKPHGMRLKYMGGCRCLLCRAANSSYETSRALARKNGDWNGLVPANAARRRLRKLSRQGVGRRAVAEACGVGLTTLVEIKSGRKQLIRARTERKILNVDRWAVAGAGHVPAERTWKIIAWLIDEGFSKAEIARRLGFKRPALQFNRRKVLARTAMKVERFYNRIMLEKA